MTEDEWLTSSDPERMLDYLLGREASRFSWRSLLFPSRRAVEQRPWSISRRKVRLYAVACCRRVWPLLGDSEPLLDDSRSRNAVEASGSYADGLLTDEELLAIQAQARKVDLNTVMPPRYVGGSEQWGQRASKSILLALQAAVAVASPNIDDVLAVIREISNVGLEMALERPRSTKAWSARIGSGVQSSMLRDIVGNPFQSVSLDPRVLLWEGGTCRKIAEGIYAEGAFDRMPILHDALLDAGCADEELLTHCRNPKGHVRGCWALDLLLAKG
jgi:hypothetical protein